MLAFLLALSLLGVCTSVPGERPAAEEPYAWLEDYEGSNDHATIEGFYHRPFEELPRELRDSLTQVGGVETVEGYSFLLRTYAAPGIEIRTTEASPEALERWRDGDLDGRKGDGWSEEEIQAEYEEELGREWLYSVTVTDETYETLYGLRVGMTVEEGMALGYPLDRYLVFGPGPGNRLEITVEQGTITQMHGSWGMGRYVGKYWDI